MIHVVTTQNQHLYGPQLDQMFALRLTAARDADREPVSDPLDDEAAIYLMAIDAWGQVDAALRIRPTASGPPVLSRCCGRLGRGADGPATVDDLAELLIGVLEYCLARGEPRLAMEVHPALPAVLARQGCSVSTEGGLFSLAAGAQDLARVRERTGIRVRVLMELAGAAPTTALG
jgi:N-acyl-L-homoserine lactone synthetase